MRLSLFLNDLLASQAKMKVARTVVTSPKLEHTGREVALLAGVSQPQTGEALEALEAFGVMESRAVGRSFLWKVNRGSEIYKKVLLPLFKAERGILKSIKKEIGGALCPISRRVILFGSIARGEGTPSSDLDLCVVTKNKRQAKKSVTELQLSIARKYNIVVSPLIYSEAEYRRSKVVKGGEDLCGQGQ